jgi:hypothetical protein
MAVSDSKEVMFTRAISALLDMNAQHSPELKRLARHFRGTFHEELAVAPPRPISKRSRAKFHAELAKDQPAMGEHKTEDHQEHLN